MAWEVELTEQVETKPWKEVRKRAVKAADKPHIARERARIDIVLALAQLRRRRKTTQAELASKLKVSQSSISQLERGHDVHLSTLASYVNGLGGRLELHAVFDDETFPVCIPASNNGRRAVEA